MCIHEVLLDNLSATRFDSDAQRGCFAWRLRSLCSGRYGDGIVLLLPITASVDILGQ